MITCPRCGKSYTPKLSNSWLITCRSCQCLIKGDVNLPDQFFKMVDDWSYLQIGSTGSYNQQSFEITGRVRIQLRNDFRNLWCAAYGQSTLWISQSLESLDFFSGEFKPFPIPFSRPKAGMYIEVSDIVKVKTDQVDACHSVRMEGEIATFPYPNGIFLFIHAGNLVNDTALILRHSDHDLQFLWGESKLREEIMFDRTRQFHDW